MLLASGPRPSPNTSVAAADPNRPHQLERMLQCAAGEAVAREDELARLKGMLLYAADESVSKGDFIARQEAVVKAQNTELELLRQQIAAYAQVANGLAASVLQETGAALEGPRLSQEQAHRWWTVQGLALRSQQQLGLLPGAAPPRGTRAVPHSVMTLLRLSPVVPACSST